MVGIKNLEVIVEDDNIWEVSLEEIAQFGFEFGLKALSYEETEKGRMLIGFLVRASDRISNNGTFTTRSMIINTLYTPVKEYKRLLVYNHVRKILNYTDENPDHLFEYTYVFVVSTYPHFLNKAAVQHIVKKLEGKKPKRLSLLKRLFFILTWQFGLTPKIIYAYNLVLYF